MCLLLTSSRTSSERGRCLKRIIWKLKIGSPPKIKNKNPAEYPISICTRKWRWDRKKIRTARERSVGSFTVAQTRITRRHFWIVFNSSVPLPRCAIKSIIQSVESKNKTWTSHIAFPVCSDTRRVEQGARFSCLVSGLTASCAATTTISWICYSHLDFCWPSNGYNPKVLFIFFVLK